MGVIDGDDIIKNEHLANAIKNAKEYLLLTEKTTAAIREEAKAMKELVAVNPMKGAKDYQDMAKALRESTKAVKEYNEVQGKARQVQKDITVATAAETKAKIEQQEQTKKLNTLLREEIALEDKQIGTLKKLAIESNKLRRERDGLNLETAEGVKRAKEINQQLDINNKKLISFSDANKRAKLNVGNYTDSINKARVGMLNLASAFGVATGIFAFTSALRGAFNIITENESALASLSAITGVTGAEFDAFKEKVTEFATSMQISSTEAAKLFEIVGSQMPQLLKDAAGMQKVAESAVTLSRASGDTVEESTRALANVMNQFSLGADQADRAMNVLAAGSLVGSAGITDVSEAMKNFGSVAAGANVSVEESVALIEVLGKFSVTGAEAGTKLRGSLLKLQQSSFGYASGQFEINDALDEAKTKMESYGTALEQDAFLQKTFGAENISTGRILLSNIGLFEEYTKGVTGTNVATDQAAINSDTLSNVVKELGAAWDNLVIKWSEGTDVAGGLKDVLRFVTENLETIMNWVVKGVTVWGSYRLALLAVNKEGTGFLQIIRNIVAPAKQAAGAVGQMAESTNKARIGFAGWVGILVALLPMLWDAGKAVFSLFNHTQSLDNVTEKLNAEMDKEKAKMEILYMQIKDTNAGSEERLKIIRQINNTYGTSLQNLSDEVDFMKQLEAAYIATVAAMEKKLTAQIMEEEYLDLLRRKREAERKKGTSADPLTAIIEGQWNAAELDDINQEIENLRKEMARLNIDVSTGRMGPKKGRPSDDTPVEEMLGLDADGKERIKKDVQDIGNIIETLPDGEKFESILDVLDKYDDIVDIAPEDQLRPEETDIEILPEDIITKATAAEVKEIYDSITESVNNLADALDELIKLRVDEIDTAIGHKNDRIQMHNERISQMKELAAQGNLTAEQSIKAEEARVSNLESDIAALERKKQKLLVINLALQTATNLAEGGDGSAIVKATEQITGMLSKIKSFKVGADRTGRGNVDKDGGSLSIIHPDEMIVQKELADPLRKAGLDRYDVATYAMAHHDDMVNGRAMIGSPFADVMTLAAMNNLTSKVDEMTNELKVLPKKMPVYKQDYNATRRMMVDIIKIDNEINNYFTYIKK